MMNINVPNNLPAFHTEIVSAITNNNLGSRIVPGPSIDAYCTMLKFLIQVPRIPKQFFTDYTV